MAMLISSTVIRCASRSMTACCWSAMQPAWPIRKAAKGYAPRSNPGLMAAATILEAKGDYRLQQLLPYASRLVARFGAATPSVGPGPAFLRNLIAGRLLYNKWFTRHVVLDRWFLHTHQEPLPAVEALEA